LDCDHHSHAVEDPNNHSHPLPDNNATAERHTLANPYVHKIVADLSSLNFVSA